MKYHWFRFHTYAHKKINPVEQARDSMPWTASPVIKNSIPIKKPQQIVNTMKSKYRL